MKRDGVRRYRETYEVVARACERSKDARKAAEVIRLMEEDNFRPHPPRARMLLLAALEESNQQGSWEEALSLWSDMEKRSFAVPPLAYKGLAECCKRGGNLQAAEHVSGVLNKWFVGRYVKDIQSFGRQGDWEWALDSFERLQSEGLDPSLKARNAVMNACKQAGRWEEALALFEGAKEDNLEPDVILHTTAVGALVSGGKFDAAMAWAKAMKERGIAPNWYTYRALITGAQRAQQWELALTLFDDLRQNGFEPDDRIYEAAILACEQGELWDALLELFTEMMDRRFFIHDRVYGSAIRASDALGKTEWSEQLRSERPGGTLDGDAEEWSEQLRSEQPRGTSYGDVKEREDELEVGDGEEEHERKLRASPLMKHLLDEVGEKLRRGEMLAEDRAAKEEGTEEEDNEWQLPDSTTRRHGR